ncbi:MAG TPA: TonB-dependent receptor [Terriglobales bacterium]|jgi:hypothetical protein|nr:TonB-dependent receptor [Terriglobales bacterium]
MLRLPTGVVGNCPFFFLLFLVTCLVHPALAQLDTATVSGQVVDPAGLGVTGAHVKLVDIDRDTTTSAATNNSGLYTFASVRPGRYRLEVNAAGFKIVNVTGLTLNVQDHIEQNFRLQIGSVAESVTVEASAQQVNTTDAAVSTVVNRQFAENLPMNGRSFQTLIDLTPGVVLTANNANDSGQFSVNGQRAASNYWMVDGVSANIGVGTNVVSATGNGLGGSLGSFSASGGTNSLVSVDAMQEFRIQTSTYAPEFGRTPGGQISIVTRSGTNQYHATAFDYLRNDVFDASNWFNGYTNNPRLPKAQERQNDFGGTFSGPILKDRTFFFFSYEGLRLRLPQTALTTVPDLNARRNAVPVMQPYLNAFPLNPNQADLGNGIAQFNASYSNPSTLDAYSLRVDHNLNNKWSLFGRYNYSPSQILQRGNGGVSLSALSSTRITTQTATAGATWIASPTITNDLRFNYSRTNANSYAYLDNFGGAVPLTSPPFPDSFTSQNAFFGLTISPLLGGVLEVGKFGRNLQRQINVTDNLSVQKGSHSLKFGADFRRLSPLHDPQAYLQEPFFGDVPSAESGNLSFSILYSNLSPTFLLRDLGIYAQDTWRIIPRLTLTYGLRWDVDFVPHSLNGPSFAAVTGFNLNSLSQLALASPGTPPYKTTYDNVAPRLGVAYQVSQRGDWQTVLRGGFGVFYDLATSEAGNAIGFGSYPFGSETFPLGGTFPLNPLSAAPPPITPATGIFGFDPHLKLPYTLEWNAALEQGLGKQQTVSASYIGAAGRRLLQSAFIYKPNLNFQSAQLVTNAGTSDYDALQLQFQRRLSQGLQGLASYTWSHSIDTASAGSSAIGSNVLVPSSTNRGPSDFDIRNAFSAGLTYDVPAPKINASANAILRGWSLQTFILVRSAPPVDIIDGNLSQQFKSFLADVRPDSVPGQPLYLFGSKYPGGKAFNSSAFTDPPFDPITLVPLRQGDVPRNFLRGFGAVQWDFAVHRDFPIHEALKLQFRAEIFNILNHPNFGPPNGCFGLFCNSPFGLSTQMLGQSLSGGNVGAGAFSPLYQIGGPRSMQLALKFQF